MDDTELNSTHLRDVSFSSYLGMVGDNFTLNLPDPPPKTPSPIGLKTPRRQAGELGVFTAERYYNMGTHNQDPSTTKLGYINRVTRTPNPRNLTTPSVSSEAISWNSRSALNTKTNKASSTKNSFFSGIRCNGRSCSDKDSVVIVDPHRKPVRKSQVDSKLIHFDGTKQRFQNAKDESVIFRSPVSIASSSGPFSNRLAPSIPNFINDDDVPRISLEVFGSSKVKKAADEEVSKMLTWDAIPRSQSTTTRTKSVDEIGSDASSDLFEIENISSHNMGRHEGMMTPTSAYEPSEASIEWSVVTASAADFSGNNVDEKNKNVGKSGGDGGGQRERSGILGCKNHKAVRVVEPQPAPISSYRASLPAAARNDKLGTTSHLLH